MIALRRAILMKAKPVVSLHAHRLFSGRVCSCKEDPCCALVYRKFFFGEAATMSLLPKKSDKHVLYRYMLSKKLQATYKGQICTKQLAKHVSLCKLTCKTIFMIDIDEMLPKLLHKLKYASIYL